MSVVPGQYEIIDSHKFLSPCLNKGNFLNVKIERIGKEDHLILFDKEYTNILSLDRINTDIFFGRMYIVIMRRFLEQNDPSVLTLKSSMYNIDRFIEMLVTTYINNKERGDDR